MLPEGARGAEELVTKASIRGRTVARKTREDTRIVSIAVYC